MRRRWQALGPVDSCHVVTGDEEIEIWRTVLEVCRLRP